MTTEELFTAIRLQNDAVIALLARLVWTPEKLAAEVASGKRNPDAYVRVYNALDGAKTITVLAEMAGVKQPSMGAVLRSWLDEGIVVNIGTDAQPKYKRLMKIPEKKNTKQVEPGPQAQAVGVEQDSNGNNGQ